MAVHTVASGESLSLIAVAYGLPAAEWRAIYDHTNNAEFRALRPDPNLIYPGDELFVPVPGEEEEEPAKALPVRHSRGFVMLNVGMRAGRAELGIGGSANFWYKPFALTLTLRVTLTLTLTLNPLTGITLAGMVIAGTCFMPSTPSTARTAAMRGWRLESGTTAEQAAAARTTHNSSTRTL